jgi:hypothetical protein
MKVCLECYSISDDGSGSENRTGYRWLLDVSKIATDCTLFTRPDCELKNVPSNCKVVRIPERKWASSSWIWPRSLKNFLRYKLWIHDVYKAARKFNESFDVAIHATLGNIFIGTELWKLGIPTVLAGGGCDFTPSPFFKYDKSFFHLREKIVSLYCPTHLLKIKFTFTCNKNNSDWLKKNKVKKFEILPDAIPRNIGKLAQSYKSVSKPIKLLWVSDFATRKGGHILELAWNSLNFKNIQLHIVGKYSFTGRNVFFHGFIDQENFLKLLGESFAVLLPSFREGFSTAAADAYSIGTPVICFEGIGPAAMGEKTAVYAINTLGDPVKNLADVLNKIDNNELDFSENSRRGLQLADEFWGEARTEKIKKVLLEIKKNTF